MKLEEAREIVQNMRNRGRALNKEGDILSEIAIALIILDDRITELEAQRDELVEALLRFALKISYHTPWLAREWLQAVKLISSIKGKPWEEIEASDNTTDIRRKPDRIDYGTGG